MSKKNKHIGTGSARVAIKQGTASVAIPIDRRVKPGTRLSGNYMAGARVR